MWCHLRNPFVLFLHWLWKYPLISNSSTSFKQILHGLLTLKIFSIVSPWKTPFSKRIQSSVQGRVEFLPLQIVLGKQNWESLSLLILDSLRVILRISMSPSQPKPPNLPPFLAYISWTQGPICLSLVTLDLKQLLAVLIWFLSGSYLTVFSSS